MIENQSIEKLKNIIDITDTIASYLELKKYGTNFKALCPFHAEKSPSFVVSPSKQIFRCFGCGASGDAISFVMEYEKLSYVEALEKLASMNNFTLEYSSKKSSFDYSKILSQTNEHFKKNLTENQSALHYLKERGVQQNSIERFGIGFARESSEYMGFLNRSFINIERAREAGVVVSDGGRHYARFSNRITFPIFNHNSRIVGFGGRSITNHPAKYLNSPQSAVFNKSDLLYGLDLAKESIIKYKKAIITEGFMDTIMLHQAGFKNAIATLGTALTPNHIRLLKRYDPKIILAYDGDSAGVDAALKGAKMLIGSGIEGGVVIFEGGLDPADMVRSGEIERLEKMFLKPRRFIEFILKQIAASYELGIPEQKQRALNEVRAFLNTLPPLLQSEYAGIAASFLKIESTHLKTKSSPQALSISHKDVAEAAIIKTLAQKQELVDFLMDFIDINVFDKMSHEFELLKSGQSNHSDIAAVVIDEKVKTLSEDELREQIRFFIKRRYERDMRHLGKLAINLREKSYLLRSCRERIERLSSGEMVVYEPLLPDSTKQRERITGQ